MILVDAHSLIFQVFHAIGEMSSPSGLPTNALFGFTRDMIYLCTERRPDYLMCAFDTPGPTFRDKLYADYKAHRPPCPDDLSVQIPLIVQMLEAMRIPILGIPGFEADDVLATVARAGGERGLEVLVCTSDKDCRQLITDRVQLLNLRKQQVFDRDALLKEWCITPEQVVDFQALVGDSVDNVPGVPGCGPKTAAKWLQQYGTLDNIIAHADELSGPKLKAAFKEVVANGKLALSKQLVTLDARVPITIDWEGWKRRDWDGQRLLELFHEFGFRGFAERVRSTMAKSGAKKNAAVLETAGLASTAGTSPAARPSGISPSVLESPHHHADGAPP